MFGEMHPPKMRQRTRPKPVPVDIMHPCPRPNCWAHMGRAANSDQQARMMLYKQRKDADYGRYVAELKAKLDEDSANTKFDRHAAKSRFQGEIRKRLKVRLKEYEESIDKRREKLSALLSKEERDYYVETIDVTQRGGETRMETMKKRAEMLTAKREAERLEVVKEKKLQQYMQRCLDLRGALEKKNIIESKNIQLQQMRENQARREMEKEMESMWHDLTMKEIQAKADREVNEAVDRYQKEKANKEMWDLQVQSKELMKAEAERISLEDRLELVKLQEQMRRDEIEAFNTKRRKRDETERELQKELKIREHFIAQRKKEEQALEQAFTMLAQIELDRERAKIQDTTTAAKREMAQYRNSLAELERQRQREEMELDTLLNQHKLEIQKKQDDAKCKIKAAKKKLHQDVMKGRAEQMKNKQELAQEQLKMQQAENELLRLAFQTNTRLEEENARQEAIARQQYKNDLMKQIEYNKTLQERERQELERQLAVGQQEEERYKKMVEDMCAGKVIAGNKHPFRKVVERYDCQCPTPTVKPPY